MEHFVYLIFSIFVTEKDHNFQKNENIALLKPSLSELTQVFCRLFSFLSKYSTQT